MNVLVSGICHRIDLPIYTAVSEKICYGLQDIASPEGGPCGAGHTVLCCTPKRCMPGTREMVCTHTHTYTQKERKKDGQVGGQSWSLQGSMPLDSNSDEQLRSLSREPVTGGSPRSKVRVSRKGEKGSQAKGIAYRKARKWLGTFFWRGRGTAWCSQNTGCYMGFGVREKGEVGGRSVSTTGS